MSSIVEDLESLGVKGVKSGEIKLDDALKGLKIDVPLPRKVNYLLIYLCIYFNIFNLILNNFIFTI